MFGGNEFENMVVIYLEFNCWSGLTLINWAHFCSSTPFVGSPFVCCYNHSYFLHESNFIHAKANIAQLVWYMDVLVTKRFVVRIPYPYCTKKRKYGYS